MGYSSLMAKNVAKDVSATIGSGKKVILKDIIKRNGYSQTVAENPKLVTSTKSYQDSIAPFVQKMIEERDMAIEQMKKTRSKAKYRDLTDAIDKLTKNTQLLTGGRVAEQPIVFMPMELMSKYELSDTLKDNVKDMESKELDKPKDM